MSGHEHGFECGRKGLGWGRGAREPFALPGTKRRYAPDRSVDVRHSCIDLTLDPEVTHIAGSVSHEVSALHDDTTAIRLHADELTIDGVEDGDGNALDWTHQGEALVIRPAAPLNVGDATQITIRYHGTPRRGIYFIHPDAGYPDKRHEAWTQGQDEDAKYWFPCFDHPSEKASTELIARVPEGYTAVSNGALLSSETRDGTTVWHWKQQLPHSAYLVTLAVGRFDEVMLQDGGVPMAAYVPQGTREDAVRAFGKTPQMVEHFSEWFGIDYPYEKYAQVVVQDFIFGGMENTTATTMIDIILFDERAALDFDMDDLVAHELAHQWWGDLLTCREWSHGWLNEGFATWSEVLWKEHDKGLDEADYDRLLMMRRYFQEESREYRRPIVDRRYEEPIDLFDRHLYEKGGLVLHMLRHELGESAYWRAIHTYAAHNRGRTVVTEDFRRAIEDATGRNMDGFLDQWVYHAGHPCLTVSWSHNDETDMVLLRVRQTQDKDDETVDVFSFAADVCVVNGEATTHKIQVRERDETFALPCVGKPTQVVFDPRGHLLANVTIEQDAGAGRAVLAGDAPLRARIQAAHALGKDPAAENLTALGDALTSDAFWGLRAESARALGAMRHPVARGHLVAALDTCAHPKVRRAIVAALGKFRHDAAATDAVRTRLVDGDPSLFVEAEAARSLGALRASDAQPLLEQALRDRDSWAETIRCGCIDGLAALGTTDALDTLIQHTRYGQPPRVRASAIRALATVGRRTAQRDAILETLGDLLTESDLRIVSAAIGALRVLGDPAAIPLLGDAPMRHPDGRIHRAAKTAAARLRKANSRAEEVGRLADDVDGMRKAHGELVARVAALEEQMKAKA